VKPPFPRISYEEAVAVLNKNGNPAKFGDDFGGNEETIISSSFDRPVLIHHYPTSIKAFYMQPDAQRPEFALAFDMIAPEGYGEIIGGSQRIHDYDLLLKRLREHNLPEESFPVVSGPAPLRQRAAFRLRNGPRAYGRLDLRHRTHSRGHPLPSHDLSRVSLVRGNSALFQLFPQSGIFIEICLALVPCSAEATVTVCTLHQSRVTSHESRSLAWPKKFASIGVPMDLGQSRRGVDMGPSALRGAGLQASIKKLGLQVEDIGNLSVKQPEEMPVGEKRAKYLQEIAETCSDVAAAAEQSLIEGFLPLVLGGDHSIAAGVAAGVANHFRKEKKQIGYLWLDAHGDMNTPESSPSGNVHGMPLAAIMATARPSSSIFSDSSPKPTRQHRHRWRSRSRRPGTQNRQKIRHPRLHHARH